MLEFTSVQNKNYSNMGCRCKKLTEAQQVNNTGLTGDGGHLEGRRLGTGKDSCYL